jgi:hypothetical protein
MALPFDPGEKYFRCCGSRPILKKRREPNDEPKFEAFCLNCGMGTAWHICEDDAMAEWNSLVEKKKIGA